MKLLHLCTDLRLGGVQRFVVDLCQELGRRHEVTLATHWSEAMDEVAPANGEKPTYRRVSFGKTSGGFSASLLARINAFLWRECPAVVHTHLFSLNYAAPSILLGIPWRTRFVHTVHSMADKECAGSYRLRRFLFRHRTSPVAISSRVKQSLNDFYRGLPAPIIHNGLALDAKASEPELAERIRQFKNKGNRRVFLHVGHLSQVKNQLLLNRVAAHLQGEGFDFAVALVGREDDADYAKQFFREQCGCVHYLGPCRHAQALLREADFFTLSSVYEGMPISLLEALACGCVPVCVPAGGIPDGCIHHQNGLLAPENSEEGLYQVMKEALTLSDEQFRTYQAASRALFEERFSIAQCASLYEQLYQGNHRVAGKPDLPPNG